MVGTREWRLLQCDRHSRWGISELFGSEKRFTWNFVDGEEKAMAIDTGAFDAVGFGKECKRLREANGLTLRDVSEAMGAKHTGAAWKMEIGIRSTVPGPVVMRRLASLFGVTTAHLLRACGFDLSDEVPDPEIARGSRPDGV